MENILLAQPLPVVADAAVDAREVCLRTAIAPAHNTYEHVVRHAVAVDVARVCE